MGGFPFGRGPLGGVVGLLEPEGVPGLPSPLAPLSPSLLLVVGVPREDEERLDRGLLSPAAEPAPEREFEMFN